MIQTVNPKFTGDKAKTAEIISRYRPIAPKPESPVEQIDDSGDGATDTTGLPLGIRRSPYLMAVWHELQARPTRTRKRNRPLGPPVPELKRSRFCSPHLSFVPSAVAGYPPVFLHHLHPVKCGLQIPLTANSSTVSVAAPVEMPVELEVPREVDFVHQLEKIRPSKKGGVISPTAIRPVGSTIMVGMIEPAKKCKNKSCSMRSINRKKAVLMKKADVERELELEGLPAVVSDSGHRVRLTNPAYNEMVGQPECPWLDIDIGRRRTGAACRRIGGEVVMTMANKKKVESTEAFNSWVRIEWGKKKADGKMENVVNAYTEAVRLACDSDDYFIQWRFHVDKEKDGSGSGSGSDDHSAA